MNLNKKHTGSLWKGETYEKLAENIVKIAIPGFHTPILFKPGTKNLFEVGTVKFGDGNLYHLVESYKDMKNNGTFYLTMSGRKNRLPEIVMDEVVRRAREEFFIY